MTIRTLFLTAAALALAAACNPAETPPPPQTPPPADIAEPTPAAGPAAENTPDSLSTAPPPEPNAVPAPAATPAPAPVSSAAPTKAELDSGRSLYVQSCAMCHGPGGAGTQMGVALTAGLEYAAIKEKIAKGMINPGDKMPPMGAALSPDQLDDLTKFVEAGLPQ